MTRIDFLPMISGPYELITKDNLPKYNVLSPFPGELFNSVVSNLTLKWLKTLTASAIQNNTTTINNEPQEAKPLASLFSKLFSFDISDLERKNELLGFIIKRQNEIKQLKEQWRLTLSEKSRTFQDILNTGSLSPLVEGSGGAYILSDANGHPRFIIKPIDEDVFCLNNGKGNGTPFNNEHHRFRRDIPLYRSCFNAALASDIAEMIGLSHMTPKVHLAILESPVFYDFFDGMPGENILADREKLCSVQEYVPEVVGLDDWLCDHDHTQVLDLQSFEEANLLEWLYYDTDGHAGNFGVYNKGVNNRGQTVMGLVKFDNDLTFAEKNASFHNVLSLLKEAQRPISERIKMMIFSLPVDKITSRMKELGLEGCREAFEARIKILQQLSQRKKITFEEMNLRMQLLGICGEEEALRDAESISELRQRLYARLLE